MANGFNVASISQWKEKATDMLAEYVLFSEDYSKYDKTMGIIYKKDVKYYSTDLYLQSYACEMSPSGGTVFTNKEVEVAHLGAWDKYCINDIKTYGLEDFDIVSNVLTKAVDSLKTQQDKLFWVGKKLDGDLMDGLQTMLSADTSVIDAGWATGTTISKTNVVSAITAVIEALPVEIAEKEIVLHVSATVLQAYKLARLVDKTSNFDQISNIEVAGNEMIVLGFPNIRLRSEVGLASINDNIYATMDDNIDRLYNETESIASVELIPDPIHTDNFYIKAGYYFGITYKFSGYWVLLAQ